MIREETEPAGPGEPYGGRVVREESRYVSDPGSSAANTEVVSSFSPARRGIEIVYLLFGVIDVLLVMRVILKVLGANSQVGFAQFIYGTTGPLLAPFRGLLPVIVSGTSVFEMSALVAIIVYSLIGLLLAKLVAIMFLGDVKVSQSTRTHGLRRGGPN